MEWKIGQKILYFGKSGIIAAEKVAIQMDDGRVLYTNSSSKDIQCAHSHIKREDYLNPCSSAACKQNGQHTYHLGCGSQYKEYCADCGELIFDSADDEIDNVKWQEIEYRCDACAVEVQPGHFACGEKFSVPA